MTEEGKSEDRNAPSQEGMKNEASEESQKVIRKPTPSEPTKLERQEHDDEGCVVFRSWCKHCNAARGVAVTHQSSPEEEECALPTVSMDYGFMGQVDGECLPVLAIKDARSA